MEDTSWIKQADTPVFDDVVWAKPQTKKAKGSLLIAGGSGQQFSAVNQAFGESTKAGIGMIDLAVPESLKQFIPPGPRTHFLSSTRTNTFASTAAGELKRLASSCQATLICGDVGRSSQTSQALAALSVSTAQPLIITRDAIDAFSAEPHVLLDRPQTVAVLSFGQLQRVLGGKTTKAITHDMGLVLLVQTLQRLATKAMLVTLYEDTLLVCNGGQVSTTKLASPPEQWRLTASSYIAVFMIQHPENRFKAATTALFEAFVADNQ